MTEEGYLIEELVDIVKQKEVMVEVESDQGMLKLPNIIEVIVKKNVKRRVYKNEGLYFREIISTKTLKPLKSRYEMLDGNHKYTIRGSFDKLIKKEEVINKIGFR